MGSEFGPAAPCAEGAVVKKMAPERVLFRSTVASLLGDAVRARVSGGDGASSLRAIARRLGVSHTQGERWVDPNSGRAIPLGDVLAMPRELARETLVRCLGELENGEGPGPRATLDAITVALGVAVADLARDLTDGRVEEVEKHRTHLSRIGTLAIRGYLALGGRAL